MLSQEINDRITRVEAGTGAGALLRLYWQPAALADELRGPRPVVPVRLMGEDLVLFRDNGGTLGLIGRRCPHRGADLCYGRREDNGLRCPFHGWHFDRTGQCVETPGEPEDSRMHENIRAVSYPVVEKNGIVWAYMGPGEPPPFPALDCFAAPDSHVFAFKGLWECNWLQALEVGIDPAHASFLHRFLQDEDPAESYGKQFRDRAGQTDIPMTRLLRDYPRPEIRVDEADHGLRLTALRHLDDGRTHVRVTNQVFPQAICIPMSNEMTITQWHVPVDDTHCYWYSMFTSFGAPVNKDLMREQRLKEHRLPDYAPLKNKRNAYGYDPAEQDRETYTGMGLDINVHDQWAVESMGAIQDRTREHLGKTDVGIIRYRRMLRAAIDAAEAGETGDLPLRGAATAQVRGPLSIDAIGPGGGLAGPAGRGRRKAARRVQLGRAGVRVTPDELRDEVKARGLETVRLSFADQHGLLRGKTLTPRALAGALEGGVAMTSTLLLKDTAHRTVFPVWGDGTGLGGGRLDGAGDVLMRPDPATFRVLPQSPHSGWLLCDLAYKDASPLPFCPRGILKRAVSRLEAAGMKMRAGLEIEFHIHRVTDPHLAHADGGMPGAPPQTQALNHGYQYLTEARYGELEPILDTIRRAAEALALPVRTVEIEFGPNQVEFTFDPADPLTQADALVLFRTTVKEICRREGLHATFMCRPRTDHAVPSGWHLHQSVEDLQGRNLFRSDDGGLTDTASGWIAGLLARAAETCLLSTPTVNGYKRYQPFMLAPDRIQWGRDNKGAMIRSLIAPGDPAARIENRVAEPAANPYLFLAAQILAGLDGVTRGLRAPEPVERPYESDADRLPASLGEAIAAFEGSAFWAEAWGVETVRWLATLKRAEWARYLAHVSDWEEREYYGLY